jgi:hypothetical protein
MSAIETQVLRRAAAANDRNFMPWTGLSAGRQPYISMQDIFWTRRRSAMTRISFRSLATRAVLAAGMIGVLAAPLPALAHGRDWHDWHRPHPVYVAPAPVYAAPVYAAPAYAAPYPAPYGYPAPAAYRSCDNALVGGLIGAAAGTLIGSGAASHGGNAGAAVGSAVGAASCD